MCSLCTAPVVRLCVPPVVCNSPSEEPYRPGWLALAGLIGLVFWPVQGFDFVRWDDDINITQNPLLTEPWSWSLAGKFFVGDQALRFEPLHWLCFRLLHAVFGFHQGAWHAFNLGLHITATVLFYVVLGRLFRRFAPDGSDFKIEWGAWFGAALWALHPLRAEAVAWVTASTYPLTAVGLLASFACYLRAGEGAVSSRRWLVLAWVFAVAAYGSYPVGVTYGLWLVVVDRWLPSVGPRDEGRWNPGWNPAWVAKHAWFLAPAALAVGVTLWSRFTAPGIFTVAPTVASVGILSRLVMALASLTYMVGAFFWPVDLTPDRPPLEVSGGVLLQVMALLALLALAYAWRERQRHAGRALVCFGFVMAAIPCLGWTEIPTWPVDRYTYIAHLVLIGGLAGGMVRWAGAIRSRQIVGGILAVGLVAASIRGVRAQTMIWHDSRTLFTQMEQEPDFADSPRQEGHIYFLWGLSEAASDRPARAAELFNRAQQVYLGAIRVAVARADYVEALSLSTHLAHNFTLTPVMLRERGAWLLRLGHKPEALVELRAARLAMPNDLRVKTLLDEARQ